MSQSTASATTAIADTWDPTARVVLLQGDNMRVLKGIPDRSMQLIVTSPPYNVGKEYESNLGIDEYLSQQDAIIGLCEQLLAPGGSICWQVGNHITSSGEVVPLDIALYPLFKSRGLILRNRIIWHFGHGLHAGRRFSGRYETILWFTRDTDKYVFCLDAVRVPQKYPGKRHYKGKKVGQYSGNPLGKNPSDFWGDVEAVWSIPNVKANHVEKTNHPCQFPIALVSRLVLALTQPDDWVLDPYSGVGSTACAAVLNGRRAVAAEIDESYMSTSRERIQEAITGRLRYRPLNKPIYEPQPGTDLTTRCEVNQPGLE